MKKILVVGGAGYVGSVLVPKLVEAGHSVKVFDTFWFGTGVFNDFLKRYGLTDNLDLLQGDIRDSKLLARHLEGAEVVIHLACISNDPSFELNPVLGRSINYDAFVKMIKLAQGAGIERFIFVSSSSVYGVKAEENVTERLACEPITDYSKYKVFCEVELNVLGAIKLPWVIIRPATVCGWSPRLRLDLSVNILTLDALTKGKITVFGGSQKRPNVHIDDITDLYLRLVNETHERVIGKTFNAGWENLTIMEIAKLVQKVVKEDLGSEIPIEVTKSDDLRSYHISSKKIQDELGWFPEKTVEDAIRDLVDAYANGLIPNSEDPKYRNIETMKLLKVT